MTASERAALGAVTLLAGALRLIGVGLVPENVFYDAAVRSMSLSAHNFFFGAFDPLAATSIDKPPLDLWLQVLSVKVLGFNSAALKYPAALAATLAVVLLYDLVRRVAGGPAGLASAVSLAVLPVSVLTARSDTMDSVMMGLLVLSAWLIVFGLGPACGPRARRLCLVAAAVVLGLAFNVKLFEALIAAPALAVLAWMGLGEGRGEPLSARLRARAPMLAGMAVAFLVTALCWLAVVSAAPRGERPFPIGSTNGSVWNAVFEFNGIQRLSHDPQPDRFGGASPASGQAPGPLRLFFSGGQDFGGLLGIQLLAGLLFGATALLVGRPWRGPGPLGEPGLARAALWTLGVWLVTGLVLFSAMSRLHQRYLEAFTPAVAAALGVGVWALAREVRRREVAVSLSAALLAVVLYGVVVGGNGSVVGTGRVLALALGAGTVTAALLAWRSRPGDAGGRSWWPTAVGALALGSVCAFSLSRDVRIVRSHSGDQAASPPFAARQARAASAFFASRQAGARFAYAASAPSLAAPLIVRDPRPVLLLTSTGGLPIVDAQQLRARVRAGEVRYLLTRGRCPSPSNPHLAACAPAVRWALSGAQDVTAQAIPRARGMIFRLRG